MGAAVLLVAALVWGCAEKVTTEKEISQAASETQTLTKVGGACQYDSYSGRAGIASPVKAESTETGVERFEVRFSFQPDEPIKQDWIELAGR